ncbi:hypothetical protein QJS64_12775 [Paraclostridium bifermentans]|uniref:MFS transporter n=1 Tax=Paraclostridium bifermentans TaxID=1490 RepID=A0ABY8R086_PARBF|nr:hypothetical protein QJS64_12775 [Paraclostridium bifermentans]
MNRSLLKNKDFSLLMAATFISTIGTIVQNTTLSLYVLDTEYIGRSNGIITTMFIGLVPLGQLFYGMLFDYMYIAIPYVISAIAYIALIIFYRRKCMLLRKHNIE